MSRRASPTNTKSKKGKNESDFKLRVSSDSSDEIDRSSSYKSGT